MPENDGIDYTCKFLYEGECWKYFRPRPCPDQTISGMRKCKQFKENMI